MKRQTWVLLLILAVLAVAAWWLWRRKGVTSVGPIQSASPAPPIQTQQFYPDGTPRPTTDVVSIAPSPIGTITYVAPAKGGLGVGGGGLLL